MSREVGATPPRVSVLMPVYDAESDVAQAVESILGQTFSDFELLVLDDGSRDRSLEIVEQVCGDDPRVRLFRNSHAGLTVRLCEGVAAARGEFIARQDADDISRPERFEHQVRFLESHAEVSVVGAGSLIIDPEGLPIRERPTPQDHDAIEARLLQGRGDAIFHSAAVFRRTHLIDAGGYRPETEPAEDVDLYLRLAERGRLANLPITLLESRQHVSRVSVLRAVEQRQKINRVLAEAHRRRGLGDAWVALPELGVSLSQAECQRRWARDAAEGGHLATARKHAWAAFRAEPLHPRSWQVMVQALLGLRVEPLRRGLRRLDPRHREDRARSSLS